MIKSKVIGLDSYLKKVEKEVTQYWVTEQTNRLLEYAAKKIGDIGNRINSYHSRHHMDDTGNLLDSLCWGLTYNGNLVGSGFFREQTASHPSTLHEWFKAETRDPKNPNKWITLDSSSLPEVWGHKLAEQYIKSNANLMARVKGWRLFFAILAPYWGYWEEGFTMRSHFGNTSRFLQFAVMTQEHDVIKNELKPMTVTFKTHKIPYTPSFVAKAAKRRFK